MKIPYIKMCCFLMFPRLPTILLPLTCLVCLGHRSSLMLDYLAEAEKFKTWSLSTFLDLLPATVLTHDELQPHQRSSIPFALCLSFYIRCSSSSLASTYGQSLAPSIFPCALYHLLISTEGFTSAVSSS